MWRCANPTTGPRRCLDRGQHFEFEITTLSVKGKWGAGTVLDQDVEALLHEQIGIQDDKPEGEGKHVITGALL